MYSPFPSECSDSDSLPVWCSEKIQEVSEGIKYLWLCRDWAHRCPFEKCIYDLNKRKRSPFRTKLNRAANISVHNFKYCLCFVQNHFWNEEARLICKYTSRTLFPGNGKNIFKPSITPMTDIFQIFSRNSCSRKWCQVSQHSPCEDSAIQFCSSIASRQNKEQYIDPEAINALFIFLKQVPWKTTIWTLVRKALTEIREYCSYRTYKNILKHALLRLFVCLWWNRHTSLSPDLSCRFVSLLNKLGKDWSNTKHHSLFWCHMQNSFRICRPVKGRRSCCGTTTVNCTCHEAKSAFADTFSSFRT